MGTFMLIKGIVQTQISFNWLFGLKLFKCSILSDNEYILISNTILQDM